MTYSAGAGPLGLQGRHTWNGIFTLNNLEAGMPYVDLDRITGLFSLPEADDLRDPRVGANGEVIYPSFTRGKTITYEGRLIAANEGIYGFRWFMLGAFANNQSNEGQMVITPHPAWGGGGWGFNARVLALDIDDEVTVESLQALPSPYQLNFVLSLRMRDNNIYQV